MSVLRFPFGLSLLFMACLVGLACGGDRSRPTPTPTEPVVTATHTPRPPPSPTEPAPAPTKAPTLEAEPLAQCDDPYPGGAPFERTPGAPVRLRPAGMPSALSPFEPFPLDRDAELERAMRLTLGDNAEHFGVYVKDMDTGRGGTISSHRPFYAASLYKVWVMMEVQHQLFDGIIDLDDQFVVTPYYADLGLNDGELLPCAETTVGSALSRMMSVSDNVAGNLLLELAGVSNINASLRRFGMSTSGFYQDGSMPTTATEMMRLLEAIGTGHAVSVDASNAMVGLLESETVDGRIPALLPPGTRIAHKTGSWPTATHDAAIVFSPNSTYALVILTDYDFTSGGAEEIARLSVAVYNYFNDPG